MDERLKAFEEKMGKSLDVLKADVIQIRAGRANPRILDKILVEYQGHLHFDKNY